MKKFLTVLLVIAVMFTFSFGTAFAAVGKITDTAEGYVDAAYTKALTDLKTVYDAYLSTVADDNVNYGGVVVAVEEAAFKGVAAKVYADYQKVLADQYRQIKADTTITDWDTITSIALATGLFTGTTYQADGTYVGASLDDAYFGEVDTVAEFETVVRAVGATAYKFDLLKAQLNLTKDYVVGELGKVDLSAYSKNVIKATDPFKTTYKEAATAVVEKIKNQVAAITVDETRNQVDAAWLIADALNLLGTDTWDGTKFVKTAGSSASFAANLLPYTEYKGTDDVVVVTSYILSGATTADGDAIIIESDETNNSAELAAIKASAKAEVAQTAAAAYQAAYNTYKAAGYTAAAKETFEAEQKKIDAYKEVVNYVIDETKNVAIINAWKAYGVNTANWEERVAEYADLEALANTAKITTDKLGELLYDSEAIDDNMDDLKWKVYALNELTHGYDDVVAGAGITTDDVDWAKAVAKAQIEDNREAALYAADGSDVYYAPEAEKVNALYDAVIAKIDACTTVAQAQKLGATIVTIPATVKTAAQVDSDMAIIVASLTNEQTMATNYINYLNNGLLPNADGYRNIDNATLQNIMVETFVEAGARTAPEAKTKMDVVYAAIDAYPTNAGSAASVAAVEEAIKALPKAITAADKEAVKAAFTAYDELNDAEKADVKASTKTTLNKAVAAIKAIEEKAITDAFKALPAVSKLTAADIDAVEAAAALVDAYESEEMYITAGSFADYTTYDETVYLNAVRDAQKADVENQIYKLGTNPTLAEVKAARDAYDAFVEKWQDASVDYKATVINYSRLLVAEKFVEEEQIAAVESLKIKASTKAYKGYIKLTWTVKGDAEDVDGYQIYRSTNYKTGGKLYYTTKKATTRSFKNTSVKKGTKYYYKVRAYKVVDGVTYYSDWSTRGIRTAK